MTAAQANAEAEINAVLTLREQQIVLFGIITMEEIPNINTAMVAARMGMSNPRSVSNAWSIIKKKIKAHAETAAGADPSPIGGGGARLASSPFVPATPASKKAKKRAVEDSESGTPAPKRGRKTGGLIEGDTTPTNRGRGRPRKNAAPVPTIAEEPATADVGEGGLGKATLDEFEKMLIKAEPGLAPGAGGSRVAAESDSSDDSVGGAGLI
ncbi:hypothetical protein QBC38DRAFT_112968 [Podospora fimiseda]|uniref:Uncharacterized protein n=1 Tax=Podospora fimiseda TaxID=252190 RepID=A0AAN6YM68_9PEZI|nr:hypothetical protein QBC38DRAFT_112968 [Podospora fimiseda]